MGADISMPADRTRWKTSSTKWQKSIDDPETKMSVWKRARLVDISRAKGKDREELRSRADLRIPALGSGSDYTVFVDHLGVASVNLGYGGEDEGGQYHSIYDDFYWYTHFQDTDFSYGRALAQTAGTMVMRMADADILPFQFSDLADTVHLYVTQLKTLATDKRDEIKERNREITEGVYDALRDPKKTLVPPKAEDVPPYLNFAPLDQASDDLTEAAQAYDKAFEAAAGNAPAGVNTDLLRSERVLTDEAGLPNRPWFQHVLYVARLLHRLRRQNHPRRPRSHRTKTLATKPVRAKSSGPRAAHRTRSRSAPAGLPNCWARVTPSVKVQVSSRDAVRKGQAYTRLTTAPLDASNLGMNKRLLHLRRVVLLACSLPMLSRSIRIARRLSPPQGTCAPGPKDSSSSM